MACENCPQIQVSGHADLMKYERVCNEPQVVRFEDFDNEIWESRVCGAALAKVALENQKNGLWLVNAEQVGLIEV